MSDYEPIELRGYYRAGHSTVWELADAAGILGQLNMTIKSLEFTESSSKAEGALFEGRVEFVSGNHISPYKHVAQNKPIVCLASPGNQVRDVVITRKPIESVLELKDKRVADTAIEDPAPSSRRCGRARRTPPFSPAAPTTSSRPASTYTASIRCQW